MKSVRHGHFRQRVIAAAGLAVLGAALAVASSSLPCPPADAGVSQTACTFGSSPSSATVSAGGGTVSVLVSSQPGCAWTATSGSAWIAVAPGSGSGSGTVSLLVAANTGYVSRSGTVAIGGSSVVVVQAGVTCSFSLSEELAAHGPGEETGSFRVVSPAACTWTAVSGSPWIVLSAGAAGSGIGTVGYRVSANPGTSPRSGNISVRGKTFSVTQTGVSSASVSCTASVGSIPQVDAAASVAVADIHLVCDDKGTGAGGPLTLAVFLNTYLSAGSPSLSAAFASGSSTATGSRTGYNSASFAVPAYQRPLRSLHVSGLTADMARLAAGGSTAARASVSLNQDGPVAVANSLVTVGVLRTAPACTSLTLSPSSVSIAAGGSSGTITVTGSPAGCTSPAWTPSSDQDWFRVSGTGNGSGSFTWSAAVNVFPVARSAATFVTTGPITRTSLPLSSAKVPVSQDAALRSR